MARKTAVEQLELNSIIVSKNASGKVVFDSKAQADSGDITTLDGEIAAEESAFSTERSSLDVRVSAEENTFATEKNSLDVKVSTEEVALTTDLASLDSEIAAEETAFSTARNSLDVRVSTEENTFDGEKNTLHSRLINTTRANRVSGIATVRGSLNEAASDRRTAQLNTKGSLNAKITERKENFSSLDAKILSEEDTTKIKMGVQLHGSTSSRTVSFNELGFAAARFSGATPSVIGMIRETSGSNDLPIIATQLSGAASQTEATFVFSDDIPGDTNTTSTYVLDVIFGAKNPPYNPNA
jgi:deoxycytidine triphosphate deaminase